MNRETREQAQNALQESYPGNTRNNTEKEPDARRAALGFECCRARESRRRRAVSRVENGGPAGSARDRLLGFAPSGRHGTCDEAAMKVFARRNCVPETWRGDDAALLLEGSWDQESRDAHRDSLDESIDARFTWIDADSVRIAEQLAHGRDEANDSAAGYSVGLLAHLGALRLRYHLVKLLRWVAYCRQVRRPNAGERWELHACQGDEDTIEAFAELCRVYGVTGRTVLTAKISPVPPVVTAMPAVWRRMAAPFLATAAKAIALTPNAGSGRRILFCGDANLLAPVFGEWSSRGGQAALLCDTPIIKLRCRRPEVRQLVCEGFRGHQNSFDPVGRLSTPTEEGVDLGPQLERWLNAVRSQHGPRWSRWLWAMDRHFRSSQPRSLVLSEDATPFARAAVWTARRHGVPSLVVQHGAPCLSFGFAPLAADRIAAWDEASREQFVEWGVPSERIVVTGSLALDQSRIAINSVRPRPGKTSTRTVLLLANLPARDDRPDGVAYHLTRATHEGMLRSVLETLAKFPNIRLIVKLHPRQIGDEPWPRLSRDYPGLSVECVRRGRWTDWLRQSSLVLSCVSSAGIEAARLGWQVVQVVPRGAGDILPAERWGLLGAGATAQELTPLVQQALRRNRMANTREPGRRSTAASRIVAAVERATDAPPMATETTPVSEESLCLHT